MEDKVYSIEAKVRRLLLTDSSNNSILSDLLAVFSGTNTLTTMVETSSGTVAAGAKSVSFTPLTGFTGTVNGEELTTVLNISAEVGKTLQSIPYSVSSGSIRIDILN